MNVSELENDRRTRLFNILLMVWLILFIATGVFFPVLSVVPEGPASDLLLIAFLVTGAIMMSLAFLTVILMITGVVSVPSAPEAEDLPWPFTLLMAFMFACLLVSVPVRDTADRVGTEAALAQLGVLFGLFMLPFVILAIVVPGIINRFSSAYARKFKTWGYVAAILIGLGMWVRVSGASLPFMLRDWLAMAVVVVGYLIFVAVRAILRRRRSNAGS